MRKLFTRLFSIFLLLLGLSFQMAYGIVFSPTTSIPTDGNTNANATSFATKFVVAFDVAPSITDAGGTAVIYKNGGLFKTFPVTKTSTSVLVVGKTLEITHGIASFTIGDTYSVAITDGAITSLAAGALNNGVYDFTIGDYKKPSLLTGNSSFTPNKGAVKVVANLGGAAFSLAIPFDEPVTIPATPGDKAVYIYKEDGTIVEIVKVSTLTLANGLQTATVTVPVAATAIFQENTNYYVVVDAGAFVDYNTYGNKNVFDGLSDKTIWKFTTQDNSAPIVSLINITDKAQTSATLNVTLSEAGKYYYAVYPSATTPSAADVMAGTGAVVSGTKTVATAGTNVTATLSPLAPGGSVAYKAWIVTENIATVPVQSAPTSVPFTTLDNTPPTSIARGTLMNAAKETNALYMVFSEAVKGSGTGTLDLRKYSDDSYVQQIAASAITSRLITSGEVSANTFGAGRTTSQYVTIVNLASSLLSNVQYYTVFPADFIKDLGDNSFVAGTFVVPINKLDGVSFNAASNIVWNFTSSDFVLPDVTAAFATPASLSSDITLTFNETIQKQLSTTADWAEVIALEQNNTPIPFTVSSPASAGSGTVIVIDPTPATLLSNTTYTVRLRKIAVKDVSSNANAITTEKVFDLKTGDLDVLTVAYESSEGPTNSTLLVANSTLKIKFNKAIKVNTTGSTWVAADATNLKPLITFQKIAANVAFTLTYDATTFTATLTPNANLASGATDYNFAFDGTKVDDAALVAPVALTASGTITYSVKDYVAPVATLSNSGNVSSLANPTITFSEDVRLLGAGATIIDGTDVTNLVTFKDGSSSGVNLGILSATYTAKVITIVPAAPLTVGKTYYYGIGASVQDASANVTLGSFGTFTMIAPSNPNTIVATKYTVNGSPETAVATKLTNITPTSGHVIVTVIFSDNIKEVNPTATVDLKDGASVIATATVIPTSVSGNTLTLDFTIAALPASASAGNELTIGLLTGLVQGSTAYAPGTFAQTIPVTVKFDSKDITAPGVSANTPASGASGVALNTALKLNFTEPVVLGSGDILIKEGATTVQTIPVNSTNVTLTGGTVATVKKADLIKYNTVYTVVVPVGAFKDDISLNSNTVITPAYTFTTILNPQPVVVSAGYSPADNSDQLSTAGTLTLGLTFSEEVIKYDPTVGSRKQWFLIKAVGATRASFTGLLDLTLNGGSDVVMASNYIETSTVGISGVNVSIATGFTPVAGDKYYVMVTPGAFLDKSTGTLPGDVIPGVFAGITDPTTWNFTTADENPGIVTFTYTKRPDNKVAKTSDIVINFSRPIKNGDGTAISSTQIATLFTLTKTATTGVDPVPSVKAFVGTISEDKKTVTILNSSLVTLGEMTELATYTIASNGTVIYANGSAISGASDSFQTSDYTPPVVTPSIAAPITDIKYVAATGHEATVTLTCTDNSNLAAVYYTIQEGTVSTPTPDAAAVKVDRMKVVTGTAPAPITDTFKGLKEETSYVVWAVAVDKAGMESLVGKVVFTTDDVTKPTWATLPTSFDAAGKLTFVFNEAVTGAASSVRILDAATMTVLDVLSLNTVAGAGNEKKLITTAFAGLATGNTLVNYYVEIEADKVADVPVVAGDAANLFVGLFRTALMVTSKDAVAPTAPVVSFVKSATDPSIYSVKLVFNEPVKKATTLPVNAALVSVSAGSVPFEVVDPANIVTDGTNTVMINVARNFASSTSYDFALAAGTFTDLSGNAAPAASGSFTTTDFVIPTVVFSPNKGAINQAIGITTLTITFKEAIRLLDNSAIDSYDLDSLVYVKKNGVNTSFAAAMTTSLVANDQITITIPATVIDATYTYGFKAKFEDAANNAVAADAATFSSVTTLPAAQYLSWTPAKATPNLRLGTNDKVYLNFTGDIYTYDATIAANSNLPVTSAYLASIITVTSNTVAVPAANLVFTLVDSKTVSVAPKAGTSWNSYENVVVSLAANKLQIGEGNSKPIPADAVTYKSQDTAAPIVLTTWNTAPFVGGYYPAKVGVAGIPVVIAKTEVLKLYFNEDVKVGTGTVEIHRWDGVLAKPVMPVTVAADKRTVLLGDLTGLQVDVEYYIIVNSGAVLDVTESNPYAGLTGAAAAKTWKILLKDDNIPKIESYLPVLANNLVNTDLTISFDRPVIISGSWYVALYKSAAGGDAVQLWRGADNGTTGAFTVSPSGKTATVDLSTLEPNTTYYVELAAGTYASAADNTKTNVGVERSVWTFSTEVNTAPIATAWVPAKTTPAVTGVPLSSDLVITFDMDVKPGIGNIQLHEVQSGGGPIITAYDVNDPTKVIFDHTAHTVTIPTSVLNLKNNTNYYVIVADGVITNTTKTPESWAGITVPFQWQFTTFSDVTAPTATKYAPNGPLAIGLKPAAVSPLTIKFSEKVVAGTGNLIIYNATTNAAVKTIGITSTQVVIKDSVVTIIPTGSALAEKTSFYVKIDATAIKDKVAGNAFAGIADATTWTFATGDFTNPTLLTTNGWLPLGKITGNHPDFKMTFNEPVKAGTGNLKVYNKATNELVLDIPITQAMIDPINSAIVNVTYVYNLAKGGLNRNTLYAVLVDKGALTDLAGNLYAGFIDFTDWNFRTGADFSTDIDLNDASQFKVYPNPFVDFVNVESSSNLSKIVVTNIAGQVVKEVVNPSSRIQLNELRSGIYFMSLYNTDNVIVKTAKISKR